MRTIGRISRGIGLPRSPRRLALLAGTVCVAMASHNLAGVEPDKDNNTSPAKSDSVTAGTSNAVVTLSGLASGGAERKKVTTPVRIDPARIDGAVSGGLRWLAEHQIREGADAGSWPVGIPNYRPAIASLAGLAFLSNGYLPGDDSQYGKTVSQTLKYVMRTMASDGYLGQGDRSGMYIHAISSLFALSCLGMQTDEKNEPELADWCRRSLEVIVAAQQVPKSSLAWGGWRYDPYTVESDVSVTCWQLLVLHTARQAGFEVEPRVFSSAMAYLRRAYVPVKPESGDKGVAAGGYLYRPGFTREPSRSSTALVLFIQSLFNATEEKRSRESLAYLRGFPPTWGGPQYGGFFYFASFYMVQGMFQIGGDDWKTYGPQLGTVLLDHQLGDGSWPYPPDNAAPEVTEATGTAYPVALAVLMLSIDKQYLPMYQRQRRFHETGVIAAAPETTERAGTETPGSAVNQPEVKVPTIEKPIEPPATPPEVTAPAAGPDAGQFPDAGDGQWEEPEDQPVRRPGGAIYR